jgi:hypothetical protein
MPGELSAGCIFHIFSPQCKVNLFNPGWLDLMAYKIAAS